MNLSIIFFINSILLGIGLAMDVFSISLVNGISEPDMTPRKGLILALTFALFQGIMPLMGWTVMHFLVHCFHFIHRMIPYVACILLAVIGSDMIRKALKKNLRPKKILGLGMAGLMLQGFSTSLDAFSVGLVITDYVFAAALVSVSVIAMVTFLICVAGMLIGRKLGSWLGAKAEILGGAVLILIGLEILMNG